MAEQHRCAAPKSNDFQHGQDAEGCWMEKGLHYEQVCGKSGVYFIVTNSDGEVVQDSRPWQMRM